MLRQTCWMSGFLALFVLLQADAVHADNAKAPATTSCDEILKGSDAPRAVLVVRAASCLMDQGKNAQAAMLLQKQLEQMEKDGVQGGKGAVENKLQTAAGKVAAFEVKTDPDTEITVDGEVIGKHPETNPLFLEPGSHVIIGKKGKAEAKVTVEAAAGTLEPLELKLVTKAEPTQWKEVLPDFGPQSDADKPKSSSKWPKWKIATTIAGGVVGLGGLGLGIGFTVVSQGYEKERADLVASFPLKTQQCSATPDFPDCKRIPTLVQQRDDASTIGIVGFVVGGVGLAAAITALVWPTKKDEPKTNEGTTAITVLPLQRGAGLSVVGTF